LDNLRLPTQPMLLYRVSVLNRVLDSYPWGVELTHQPEELGTFFHLRPTVWVFLQPRNAGVSQIRARGVRNHQIPFFCH
jgi:hypothetical protein